MEFEFENFEYRCDEPVRASTATGLVCSMVQKYKAVAEHLSCDLNGESVILNMKNGTYYGVNTVGASIWAAIQSPLSIAELQSAIMAEYDVNETTCRQAIQAFLDKMIREDLIEILDDKDS